MSTGAGNVVKPEGRADAEEQGVISVAITCGHYRSSAILYIDDLVIDKTNVSSPQPGADINSDTSLVFFADDEFRYGGEVDKPAITDNGDVVT